MNLFLFSPIVIVTNATKHNIIIINVWLIVNHRHRDFVSQSHIYDIDKNDQNKKKKKKKLNRSLSLAPSLHLYIVSMENVTESYCAVDKTSFAPVNVICSIDIVSQCM